ncbi:MAG: serine protease [Reyranellaceae bacterium]
MSVWWSYIAIGSLAIMASQLLSIASSAEGTTERVQRIFEKSQRSMVKITVTGTPYKSTQNRDKTIEGTGFIVYSQKGRTYLLTALHVIGSSDTDPSKNRDWNVEFGAVDRKIALQILDARGNLTPITTEVEVVRTEYLNIDIAILSFSGTGYPILPLGDPLLEKVELRDVMLMGFRKGKKELSQPPQTGRGVTKNLKYLTNASSLEGESGGPWIDIDTGKVFAVASLINNASDVPSKEATPVTLIKPTLDNLTRNVALTSKTAVKVPENYTRTPIEAQVATKVGRPSLSGLDILYFEKAIDEGVVEEVLRRERVTFRPIKSSPGYVDETNVVTCGSSNAVGVAKWLAVQLLDAGVRIKGIAPQANPVEKKITIEHYPEYVRQPVLTKERLSAISRCPGWSEIVAPSIKITNSCANRYLDTYVRYFHPTREEWITAVKYGLKPGETWEVSDENGVRVGSGRPYVLALASPSIPYQDLNYRPVYGVGEKSSLDPTAALLNGIPDNNFLAYRPVINWGCPIY